MFLHEIYNELVMDRAVFLSQCTTALYPFVCNKLSPSSVVVTLAGASTNLILIHQMAIELHGKRAPPDIRQLINEIK